MFFNTGATLALERHLRWCFQSLTVPRQEKPHTELYMYRRYAYGYLNFKSILPITATKPNQVRVAELLRS
jgi:hypothetical protein